MEAARPGRPEQDKQKTSFAEILTQPGKRAIGTGGGRSGEDNQPQAPDSRDFAVSAEEQLMRK